MFSWNKFWTDKREVILFGAGCLAAEYLDKYSWQKPIKFIVDNDPNKIGKSFKGYLIKKPTEILHFKESVVVLITNELHEMQISEQLDIMGINEYYCYYSMQGKRFRNNLICNIKNKII